jgi:predicted membrane metal-binding protein
MDALLWMSYLGVMGLMLLVPQTRRLLWLLLVVLPLAIVALMIASEPDLD